jgi:quercetin dioxygenase-like cupin family protein
VGDLGWTAARLDELEAIAWQGTELTWRPLRGALGTHVCGMAAFTAERAGQEVVEAHAEAQEGRGHEEVYVVLRGRATFTLGGTELDAPAGTFVRVAPATRRYAVAAEPGTAVLALGGPPGFTPSASEWIERARAHARDDPARATAIIDGLRALRPESPGVDIGEALLALARGDRPAATRALGAVVDRHPEYRDALVSDPDLGPLAGELP